MQHLRDQIGAAVRSARRRKKGLTQEKLAAAASVSMETISNVERGSTLPSVDVLFKIARALSLDLDELVKAMRTESADAPNADPNEAVPAEPAPTKERLKLERSLADVAQRLPDGQLQTLIEIARVLSRGV